MLDQELVRIAHARIAAELVEDSHRLESELSGIVNDMSGRGMLESGITLTRVVRAYEEAILRRAAIVWTTLHRFVTTPGISYSETLCVFRAKLASDSGRSCPPIPEEVVQGFRRDVVQFFA